MEPDKICDAIHQLELNLTERIYAQTTTIEVMGERLDHLRHAVDRHREILYGHDDGDHLGLVSEMSELTKKEQERKWTLRTVTASFFGLLGKFVWDLFHA
jgi:hypothetical protein